MPFPFPYSISGMKLTWTLSHSYTIQSTRVRKQKAETCREKLELRGEQSGAGAKQRAEEEKIPTPFCFSGKRADVV